MAETPQVIPLDAPISTTFLRTNEDCSIVAWAFTRAGEVDCYVVRDTSAIPFLVSAEGLAAW